MFCSFKKAKGGIFLGIGIGILSVMIIPLNIWLIIISLILIFSGLKLLISKKSRR